MTGRQLNELAGCLSGRHVRVGGVGAGARTVTKRKKNNNKKNRQGSFLKCTRDYGALKETGVFK